MGGIDPGLVDGQIDSSYSDRAEDGVYLENDLVRHLLELDAPTIIEYSDEKVLLVKPEGRSDSGHVASDDANPGGEYALFDCFGRVARFPQDSWQQAGESFH